MEAFRLPFSVLVGILSGTCFALLICSNNKSDANYAARSLDSLELTMPIGLDPWADPNPFFEWLTSLSIQSQQKVNISIHHGKNKFNLGITCQPYLTGFHSDLMDLRFFPKSVEVNGDALSGNQFYQTVTTYVESSLISDTTPSFLVSVVSKKTPKEFYSFLEIVSETNSELVYVPAK